MAGLEEAVERGWLPGITFAVEFWDTQCNFGQVEFVWDSVKKRQPHVLFGPSCRLALLFVSLQSNDQNYKLPLLTAGGYSTEFTESKSDPEDRYWLLTRTGASYRDVARTFVRTMQENKWTKFLLLYKHGDRHEWNGDDSCRALTEAVQASAKAAGLRERTLRLDELEEEHPLSRGSKPTLDQYIHNNMTMLEEELPKNKRR